VLIFWKKDAGTEIFKRTTEKGIGSVFGPGPGEDYCLLIFWMKQIISILSTITSELQVNCCRYEQV
jgi:hypothetical protein